MKKLFAAGLLSLVIALSGIMPGLAPVAQAYEDIRYDDLHTLSGGAVDGLIINVERFKSIGMGVTITGTVIVTPEVSMDGLTFYTADCTSQAIVASAMYYCEVGSNRFFRARISSFTSGTVSIKALSTTASANLLRGIGSGAGGIGRFSFDSSNNLNVNNRACVAGESVCIPTAPNEYLMINGAEIRDRTGVTGVTTNTTSAIFTLPTGAKTPRAKVEGTGAVTATLKLYGSYDTSTVVADAVLLCTSTLSGTTKKAGPCDSGVQFTQDFPNYFIVSSNVTGTGATAEMKIGTGIAASAASAGGAGDASAANQTTEISKLDSIKTAVETIDNMISGTGANISQINGVTPLMGSGATGTGSPRTTESTDSQLSADTALIKADIGDTSDAAATVGGTGSLSAKLRVMTTQLNTITAALQLIDDDQTGGTACALITTAATNATNCKASAGRVMTIHAVNTTATLAYLRLYNASGTPTCSSATGFVESIPIPASTTGAGFSASYAPFGQAFSTGIAWCVTGGGSSTDNTSSVAGVYVKALYK